MVHKTKKKEKFVVSAIYGTHWFPILEGHLVTGKKGLEKKIKELKKRGDVKLIRVERDGIAYIRGFTVLGEVDVIKALQKDIPHVTEVVYVEKPKGFFSVPKVVKVETGKEKVEK